MSRPLLLSLVGVAMTLAACAPRSEPAATAAPLPSPRADLERLAARSVLFGHQSVGANLLDGVGRLVAEAGAGPRVVLLAEKDAAVPRGTLAHAYVPANGDPLRKLRSFASLVDRLGAGAPEVALVKLCYVDFEAGTDPAALFEAYRTTLDGLALRHPRTTFVPVTAPLTTVQSGPKALVKRLLGRAPGGVAENAVREAFNARLRAAYGLRVFDLARLESTRPDGATVEVEWNGARVPALATEYTRDGGHLEAAGQDRISRALVSFLAALPSGDR